jgi:S-layer protein
VLTNATITGSAALIVDFDSTNNTKLASIDGSAATGNLTLNNTAVATTIKTGAGDDKFTATVVGTTKATVDSGAGADIVTLAGGLVAGSTVNLGAGNDTLLGTTVVAASTATAVTCH